MKKSSSNKNYHDDAKIILAKGGQTKFARWLGLDDSNGVARVGNWMRRGIPMNVRYLHPKIDRFSKQIKHSFNIELFNHD